MVQLVEDQLDIDTYMELREAVHFPKLSRDQARRGLDNSLYTLVAFKDGKAVGMGRIVGDGAIICYVQDLIIRPEVQGEGIGGLILESCSPRRGQYIFRKCTSVPGQIAW